MVAHDPEQAPFHSESEAGFCVADVLREHESARLVVSPHRRSVGGNGSYLALACSLLLVEYAPAVLCVPACQHTPMAPYRTSIHSAFVMFLALDQN